MSEAKQAENKAEKTGSKAASEAQKSVAHGKKAPSETQNGEFAELSLSELMAQLDETVAWFNSGDVDIDAATAKFDYGSRLVAEIKSRLTVTENKINQIKLRLS